MHTCAGVNPHAYTWLDFEILRHTSVPHTPPHATRAAFKNHATMRMQPKKNSLGQKGGKRFNDPPACAVANALWCRNNELMSAAVLEFILKNADDASHGGSLMCVISS